MTCENECLDTELFIEGACGQGDAAMCVFAGYKHFIVVLGLFVCMFIHNNND